MLTIFEKLSQPYFLPRVKGAEWKANLPSTIIFLCSILFYSCTSGEYNGAWDYTVSFEKDEQETGVMRLNRNLGVYEVKFISFGEFGTVALKNVALDRNKLSGEFELWDEELFRLVGTFEGDTFKGFIITEEKQFPFTAERQSDIAPKIDRTQFDYLLADTDLPESEKHIDHAGIIANLDRKSLSIGERIYNGNCINCHGNQGVEGSIPISQKFWEPHPYKAGTDFYSMYRTLSLGVGNMPAQPMLTPQEKYSVILFIQQEFIKQFNEENYISPTDAYLATLPKGSSRGPEAKPYTPWSDMDYGDFLIYTYELVDEEKGPERFHSPGPVPYVDEDYSKNNFAYKGIAVRLDKGPGGVSKGKAWMVFDHDLMRVAGGWTGEGFIDWEGILLNDRHEVYPQTIGKLHFETPIGPGWANPGTGSFEDPRFRARDGRAFGPLPKKWANYKGLYHDEDHIIISYSVGASNVLERLGMEKSGAETVFTRTLNVSPSNSILKMRVAPAENKVKLIGEGASLTEEDGFHLLNIEKSTEVAIKLYVGAPTINNFEDLVSKASGPESLVQYTNGGKAHYPEELKTTITKGLEEGPFAVDQLTPPFDNPWACRMRLSGIDFMANADQAVACTVDGDIWLITGLTDEKGILTWKRIGAGLFQPLGIKVLGDKIYVICRDQLVLLQDFNGDGATDFYQSFNHDHQVTDHFHEFAMGLQADKAGNLYYAKSGRHAREALVPQHGTLIKVSKDGATSEVIATGFRAANGVCINPDGSFIVTDQQGYWNPMNRINWVKGKGRFYGNMWGYDPPNDTTRAAMQQPMVWVDMEFCRSPSELLWVDSEQWGPLDGSLLAFSYGFGKIQLVLNESINGQEQGGVIDLPGVRFLTGVMRGRFNPKDGHLYACGMSAWGSSQTMRVGDLYRVRYTGKALPIPVGLKALETGVELTFVEDLDPGTVEDTGNYTVKTWNLLRSRKYGSKRYNTKTLNISSAQLLPDGKTVQLRLDDMDPVDVMTISYKIKDTYGNVKQGTLQNTIHNLGRDVE